jgi:hypothetical protein
MLQLQCRLPTGKDVNHVPRHTCSGRKLVTPCFPESLRGRERMDSVSPYPPLTQCAYYLLVIVKRKSAPAPKCVGDLLEFSQINSSSRSIQTIARTCNGTSTSISEEDATICFELTAVRIGTCIPRRSRLMKSRSAAISQNSSPSRPFKATNSNFRRAVLQRGALPYERHLSNSRSRHSLRARPRCHKAEGESRDTLVSRD